MSRPHEKMILRDMKASKGAVIFYSLASGITLFMAFAIGGIGAWALFAMSFAHLCGDMINFIWCGKRLRDLEDKSKR